MKEELEEKLVDRFWFLKTELGNSMNPYPMFGMECGNGWFTLIKKLCEKIEKQLKKEKNTTYHLAQIKEKFGGLRWYDENSSKEINDLVFKAEEESYKICEICGESGELRSRGSWVITLCDACHEKDKRRNNEI